MHAVQLDETGGAVPPVPRAALGCAAFRRVQQHVEHNLGERIGLAELARVAGLSRYHFARQFRLRTGHSPMGFVRHARIERARARIAEGGVRIADIAAELGFADQSHFTRSFRRVVGMAPSEYARAPRSTTVQAARAAPR